MRLGVFGGTFDPPHVGHFLVASDACDALALNKLIFVPAGAPPFKTDSVQAAPEQRFEMLRLMVGADQRFSVDRSEIDRKGVSYTLDTVVWFAERYPDAERYFLIGEDLVEQFATWREPERIAALTQVVVLARNPAVTVSGKERVPFRRLATRVVEVSSTEVRERSRSRKAIRGFVPDAVAEYIRSAGLYQ